MTSPARIAAAARRNSTHEGRWGLIRSLAPLVGLTGMLSAPFRGLPINTLSGCRANHGGADSGIPLSRLRRFPCRQP